MRSLPICCAALLASLMISGCSDETPTTTDPALIPVTAETFEVSLSFEDFAEGFRVDGGYGSPSVLSVNRLRRSVSDDFEVRTLYRFAAAPPAIQVFPEGAAQTVPDSAYVPTGGRVTVSFDTLATRIEGVPPFSIRADALTEEWDPITASWTHAIDTLGGRELWSEPGAGAVRPIAADLFDPEESSSITFELDSLTATEWASAANLQRGMRLSLEETGTAVRISSAILQLDLRSDVNPDTTVVFETTGATSTMILSRQPDGEDGRLLVGGAPAFRSTFRLMLPDSVEATGPVCGGAASCMVELTPEKVIFAGLTFHSIPSEPAALAPADSLVLDLRPVLSPERLPRSPLGNPVLPQGRTVGPGQFMEDGESPIEIPVTRLVRDLVRHALGEANDDGGDGTDGQRTAPPSMVSLISASEPSGIGVASFGGPGTPREPILRLILTTSDGVSLP